MKNKLLLIFSIFVLVLNTHVQSQTNYTNPPSNSFDNYNFNVLNAYIGYMKDIRIRTKIPFSESINTTLTLKGYDGNASYLEMDLKISWFNWGGGIYSLNASSAGQIVPEIKMNVDQDGYTNIYLSGNYYVDFNFSITATANNSKNYVNPAWFTEWEIIDEPLQGNIVADASISNSFGNINASYISSYNGYVHNLSSSSLNSFNVTISQKLGIGTSSPLGRLQVKGQLSEWDGATRMYLTNNASSHGRTNLILTGRVDAGNDDWYFGSNARNSIVFNTNSGGFVGAVGTERYSIQLNGANHNLGFLSTAKANVPVMVLTQTGNVGIGTVSPQALLSVNGTAMAKKVKVSIASTDWPDYVFKPTYQLRTLSKLEEFIKHNKHLPDVPSADEVGKNGVDLGENQAILLKKIEELTLYVIEQNKKSAELSKKIAILESKMNSINKRKK